MPKTKNPMKTIEISQAAGRNTIFRLKQEQLDALVGTTVPLKHSPDGPAVGTGTIKKAELGAEGMFLRLTIEVPDDYAAFPQASMPVGGYSIYRNPAT